ncbi:MAG: Gfo/Idh/MocA family oxidoreductase [Verrucomicrobiae bacterium]|nr:Gfo/Idh/MocA family oxidoreductase [Verrucomicrobiae bacterium]NNJ42611.1 Gfo/Idh/MocA family oxidoreductase [Akkermansiaceae bacterium]
MSTHPSSPDMARRRFLKTSLGAASALGFPTIIPATALGKGGKAAPSERVTVGMIACGNRGRVAFSYAQMPDVEVVALADPNAAKMAKLKAHDSLKGKTLKETADFRTILTDDIDAMHIATGDYWHVPAMLLAARAGKHAYVEKPLGISIEQCLACNEIVQERPELQIQYGTQNRSGSYVRPAMELVLNGHIGEVKEVIVWAPEGESGGVNIPKPAPDGFNLDMWFGPAPLREYSNDRCEKAKGIYHIYDHAIGYVAGWGAHPMDQLQWWLDETGVGIPVEVNATGKIPTTGLYNTVTHWDAEMRYANDMTIRFADRQSIDPYLPKLDGFKKQDHGTLFLGSDGWVYCSRYSIQASSRELLAKSKNPGDKRLIHSKGKHERNFIDAIKGDNQTVTNLPSAIRSDVACHLIDLAIRHGGSVRWDQSKQTILGNDAAQKAMHRPMRQPWDVLNPKYTGA